MKIVISDPKTGKSWQREIEATKQVVLFGKKIGDTIDGSTIGFEGYKFIITGGSDKDGTPMRKDIQGTERVKAFLSSGPGFRPKRAGERRKKYLRGRTVGDHIVQLNLKVAEYGSIPLDQIFPSKEEAKKAE